MPLLNYSILRALCDTADMEQIQVFPFIKSHTFKGIILVQHRVMTIAIIPYIMLKINEG